jgi:hypothetical protein
MSCPQAKSRALPSQRAGNGRGGKATKLSSDPGEQVASFVEVPGFCAVGRSGGRKTHRFKAT